MRFKDRRRHLKRLNSYCSYYYPPRGRHQCDKGSPLQRFTADAFRWMLDGHFWRRHHEPWSKTDEGRKRREERRFVRYVKTYGPPEHIANSLLFVRNERKTFLDL